MAMDRNGRGWLVGAVVLLGTGLMACSATPEERAPEPAGPADQLDAFEEVGEPRREYSGTGQNDPDNLSSDIERLQDARREYNQTKARESAELNRRQAKCRESGEGREVAIQDGSEAADTYCEPPVE